MIGRLAHHLKTTLLGGRSADFERVYRSPPLTQEHVEAIRRIAPECDYRPEERYRDQWDRIENEACWREFRVLQPALAAMPKPRSVLEIGPGLGRSLVFFTKTFGWQDADLHAYEGEGQTTKYTKLGPRFEDSFCGSFACLRASLEFNGIRNVRIHDANQTRLAALPGPFDLIYSFYSIGFHWAIEHFLDDLMPLLGEDGTAIFTVPPKFVPPREIASLSYRLLPLSPMARKERKRNSLLLLRKHPFPAA